MPQDHALISAPVANRFQQLPTSVTPLTDVQLDRLNRCASGNTLRFEASGIVDALVAGGYAKQGIGRVVTVTAKGQQYLRTESVKLRLERLGFLR